MSASSRRIDRLQATFDHDGIVVNAGLVVPATLMARLGVEALIDAWVRTGSARPGREILTVVAAMKAASTATSPSPVPPAEADPMAAGRVLEAPLSWTPVDPTRSCQRRSPGGCGRTEAGYRGWLLRQAGVW